MNSKKIKKIIGLFVAMVLVCVASVAGTLAVLKAETTGVTNTFTPTTHLMDNNNADFKVTETAGDLVLTPLAVINKNAVVSTGTFQTDGVVYLEVAVSDNTATIGGVDNTQIVSFGIDACWHALEGKKGAHGGQLYVYKPADSYVVAEGAKLTDIGILVDDKVTVADYTDGEVTVSPTISFYGYAMQSLYATETVVSDDASAWAAWDSVWDAKA